MYIALLGLDVGRPVKLLTGIGPLAVPSRPAMGAIGDLSLLKASLAVCKGVVRPHFGAVGLASGGTAAS